MSAHPGILGAVAALALAACGSDTDRGGPGGTTTTTTTSVTTTSGTGTSTVPTSDCPDALAPLADQGQVETVGDGTAASCTEAALRAAVTTLNGVAGGGTIHFDCGGEATLTLASSLLVTAPLLVDGGGVVTLSGGGTTRVFELDHYVDFAVQRLTIANGVAPDSGGAILHPWYGTLRAVDVRFVNNHALSLESDIGGGAVFAGGLTTAVFSGCVFEGNSASNGGGLLNRGSDLTVIDTAFVDNAALSTGDGQFGNGGGLYIDGMNYDVPGDFRMCGAVFTQNRAQTHGSAVFSYFYPGSHSFIDRTLFEGNHFDGSPSGGAGGLYHEAVPL
ncbi:MAG: hypothetical protein IT373_18685, partial [Polyangiaceae bacterium]|nr:hypothetical protein [Polyangiaceae bacterium]